MSDSLMRAARENFPSQAEELRPELHRYCARMTGSVFDGEDIVQETLARALAALEQMTEPPNIRPWLFRIAHNAALDFLKRAEHRRTTLVDELPEEPLENEPADNIDPIKLEAALSAFVALPPIQRSALALRDVLGLSLEQIVQTTGASLPSVKAALVRARRRLEAERLIQHPSKETLPQEREHLRRYASLFTTQNWSALRDLLQEDVRLDLISRAQRRGAAVREYFSRYEEVFATEELSAVAGFVGDIPCVGVMRRGKIAYFILIEWSEEKVLTIRDFRYVPYICAETEFSLL
jgi:RNA polymerase sigma-70 factor (ECF subfamily)